MSLVYKVTQTTNMSDFPSEVRYASALHLAELKKKLELVVGAPAQRIRISLLPKNNGDAATLLKGDDKTLEELGLYDGCRLHAVDETGENKTLTEDVEKYEISEEAYAQRADSVRAFKNQLRQQGFKQEVVAEQFDIGARCIVSSKDGDNRRGTVTFYGEVKEGDGPRVGVVFDEPVGKNDGSANGRRFFECAPGHGSFCPPQSVHIIREEQNVEMEEI